MQSLCQSYYIVTAAAVEIAYLCDVYGISAKGDIEIFGYKFAQIMGIHMDLIKGACDGAQEEGIGRLPANGVEDQGKYNSIVAEGICGHIDSIMPNAAC